MSIESLLSHHGVHIPRYVTVNGRVVFDGVTVTSGGAVHASLGPVTAVRDHTFHGGQDRPGVLTAQPWWTDASQLARQVSAMQRFFPGFVYTAATSTEGPRWMGSIDTGRGKFTLEVELREDRGLPMLRVIGPQLGAFSSGRWVPSPHLYASGRLCVADSAEWDPEQHDVATAVAWGAHWLAAYTEWRMSRRWPADGTYAHAS